VTGVKGRVLVQVKLGVTSIALFQGMSLKLGQAIEKKRSRLDGGPGGLS